MLGNNALSAAALSAFVASEPSVSVKIAGYTRTRYGVIEPSCTVRLFRTSDNVLVSTTTSDAGGYYEFLDPAGSPFFAVAYKDGTPDIAGTTVNTLTPA